MMKQEDLFKKLGLILNELNEQYQFLAQNPQQLNELELELFHANANFLADHVQIVKKIGLTQQPPQALVPAVVEIEDFNKYTLENIEEEQQLETIAFADEEECEPEVNTQQIVNVEVEEVKNEPITQFEELEEEVFKLDNSPSTFEFILNDHATHETIEGIPQMDFNQFSQDSFITNENKLNIDEKFEFEEKSVDELFNRPLSEAEERILAEKRKLSEQTAEELQDVEEDEIGPEPFLVHKEIEVVEEFLMAPKDLALQEAPAQNIQINKVEPVEDTIFKPTLNDILAGQTVSTSSINSASSAGITDLKQAINLNDKLLYIKDLFNDYNLAYAEAIDLANKLPNFETADNFFQKNYAVKNNWASKQTTVDKFYQILNQRFR